MAPSASVGAVARRLGWGFLRAALGRLRGLAAGARRR